MSAVHFTVSLWDLERPISTYSWASHIDIPPWIEPDISPCDVAAIGEGGCASGAYMPAVTYYTAGEIMATHGDAVLDYLVEQYGELPKLPAGTSWSASACFYLSAAVECWTHLAHDEIIDALEDYFHPTNPEGFFRA